MCRSSPHGPELMDSPAQVFRRERLAAAAATSPEQLGHLLRPSLARARQHLGELAARNSSLTARLHVERYSGDQPMDALRSRARTWTARVAELEAELRWRCGRPEAEASALRAELLRCRSLVAAAEAAGTATQPSNVVVSGRADASEHEPYTIVAANAGIDVSVAIAASEAREHGLREEAATIRSGHGEEEARLVERECAIGSLRREASRLQGRREVFQEEARVESLDAQEAYQCMVQCAVGILEVQQRMHQMEDQARSCELATSELQSEHQTGRSSAEYVQTRRELAEDSDRVAGAERQELLLAVASAHGQNQILAEEAASVAEEQLSEERAAAEEAHVLREALLCVEASTPCLHKVRMRLKTYEEESRRLHAELEDGVARARRAEEECSVWVDEKSVEASETKGLVSALRRARGEGRDLEASLAEEELACRRQAEALEEARRIPSADSLREQLRCEQHARVQAASSYEILETSLSESEADALRSSASSSCTGMSIAFSLVGSPSEDSPDSRRFRGQRAQLDRSMAVRLRRFEQRLEAQHAPEARRLQAEHWRLEDAVTEARRRQTPMVRNESAGAAAGRALPFAIGTGAEAVMLGVSPQTPSRTSTPSSSIANSVSASFSGLGHSSCRLGSPNLLAGSPHSALRSPDEGPQSLTMPAQVDSLTSAGQEDADPRSSSERLPDVATVITCQGRWAAAASMAGRERLAARLADQHARPARYT